MLDVHEQQLLVLLLVVEAQLDEARHLAGGPFVEPLDHAGVDVGPILGDAPHARPRPGVHLVLTGADLAHLGDLRSSAMQKQPDGTRAPTRDIPILCRDRVNHVGDAVAFVVADSRALAQDAAELIEVDYDSEDAAAVTATALDKETPLVWPELGSNRAFLYELGDKTKTDAAFARAARTVGIKFVNNRLVSNYMEARSAIGEWKPDEDRFVLTTGSQGVHGMRDVITRKVFKSAPEKLRVITRDVGGGFGPQGPRLPRVSAGARGRQAARPAGQMDGRPHRAFPRRCAWPRQLCRGRNGARRATAASSGCAST